MTCPPCNNNCDEGRTCPAKNKTIEEDDDIQDYKRPWVGLTYEQESELIRLAHNHAGIRFYIRAAEAKLKELNT